MTKEAYDLQIRWGHRIDISNPYVRDLVTKGYGFDTNLLSDDFADWRGKVEYHFAKIVYMISVDSIPVASMSVNPRSNTADDPFWGNLRARRSDLSDPNTLACYIQGIVVHPSYRNRGIASHLLHTMTEFYQPAVIMGQTKTPEVVAVRSKILQEYGYRSFYGFHEVTPGAQSDENTKNIDSIQAAFASEQKTPDDLGIYIVDPDILPSYTPNTDRFPPEIQRAFLPIIETQKSLGPLKAAASVFVSVKNTLI